MRNVGFGGLGGRGGGLWGGGGQGYRKKRWGRGVKRMQQQCFSSLMHRRMGRGGEDEGDKKKPADEDGGG